ncbi:AAA family ATPase [Arthrobacter sp. ISL-95]|uniref:AAA family ATPase n=1 Tax=Arthrobacter sp. ISL-95 TaxID=2819116 RepID=UPI001BEBDD16|nr:AAA family ATPase [Arthrobacter sp. ISL-95]MBT2588237.1 AAA family ATPase [Arthrobacter sp. ISL-95]
MPELILLNGPPGIGKSTLAGMYVDQHPGVLNLDVDQVRCLIGGWKEDFQAAGDLVRPIALSMAATHLSAGHTVIMPQYLDSEDEILLFRTAAEEAGAGFREVVLMDSRDASVERFYSRTDGEDPWHARVTAIVEEGGGSHLLESMYDDLIIGLDTRPSAATVASHRGHIQETYELLMEALALTPP